MKRFNDESGQALIISALCMTCLFGFIALAVDAGIMLRDKRLLQIAADSAAIAGALELNYYPAGVIAAAKAASAANGFADTVNGATVTVSDPTVGPTYGPHAGNKSYVEVIVSQSQPTFFMKFFGLSSMTPTVRAVAQNGGSSFGCINVQSPNAAPAMKLQGSFEIDAPNCGIVINSNDPNGALKFQGNGGSITAGSIGVVGGINGYHIGESSPAPISGIVPQSDPLSYLGPSFPTPTGCVAGGSKTGALASGCYSGDASGNLTLSNVILTGMYVFSGNGTVTLSGSVTTGAGGTTIDLISGGMTEASGTTLNLVAPTDPTNTFHGIVIMAPPTNTSTLTLEFGNATGTIDGIFYAPGANLFLHDSGGGSCPGALLLTTDLIVGTLDDQTGSVCITSYSQTTPGSPLTKVMLVE
jgi:Flp pilus assembly protein TadG